MGKDIFQRITETYSNEAKALVHRANANTLFNPSDTGLHREQLYADFLERHLPKSCDVFLGGQIFDITGHVSRQMDIIVTTGDIPRFLNTESKRVAPLEGTLAAIQIKSNLTGNELYDALETFRGIPAMPEQSREIVPQFTLNQDRWRDTPYKAVIAYGGLRFDTIYQHIKRFYLENETPLHHRANLVHVLGEYGIIRPSPGDEVLAKDGTLIPDQPDSNEYQVLYPNRDSNLIGAMFNEIQIRNNVLRFAMWNHKYVNQIADQLVDH